MYNFHLIVVSIRYQLSRTIHVSNITTYRKSIYETLSMCTSHLSYLIPFTLVPSISSLVSNHIDLYFGNETKTFESTFMYNLAKKPSNNNNTTIVVTGAYLTIRKERTERYMCSYMYTFDHHASFDSGILCVYHQIIHIYVVCSRYPVEQ